MKLVAAWTTSEELFEIAANHLSQLRESLKQAPGEMRALCADPHSADGTIDQLMQLFHRFQEQADVWERSSDLPSSFPEGSSSRALGIKLLKNALQAFDLAIETIGLIPADAFGNYLERRIACFSQEESDLEKAMVANNWDPHVRIKLEEIRTTLQFCTNAHDAAVTLRLRAAKICLKLAQGVSPLERPGYLGAATILLDQAQKVRPDVSNHPAFTAIRANIPVLQHLLETC